MQADKSTGTIEEMTVETVKHVRERHFVPGETETPNTDNTAQEADYDREQMAGPLSSRAVGKENGIHKGNTASEDAVRPFLANFLGGRS